ncbi:DUF3515 family protein [Nocardioides sp. YIM 152588]|uniref:DUF3515 family protein n=1 Tax=Nocardioides sp. YIM 152588 TaxID=3158259 RepID=UPI0032E3B225
MPAAAAAGLGVVLLAGCGGPVQIDVPDLDADDAAACAAFADDLPATLAEQERVESEPADAPGAAYGDPPIVVTCGVGEPPGFTAGSQCELVNDVGWYIPDEQYEDDSLDLTIYSAANRPRVEVLVPGEYRPNAAAAVMAALAPLVTEHTEQVSDCV